MDPIFINRKLLFRIRHLSHTNTDRCETTYSEDLGQKNPFVIELSYSKIGFVGIKVIPILVMSNNRV
jgi:hypothetical protein